MILSRNIFDIFCLMECCSNYWIKNDINELDTRLKNQLIGQPLAYDLILKSIRSHILNRNPSKSLVLSLHGGTGTGKNFVAKHIVESLYLNGYRSKYVKLYVVSREFMHSDSLHINQYKDKLTNDIESITKKCSQAIFIFDEIDQMPNQLLNIILYYIDFHTPTNSRSIDFRYTTFIFLSNVGTEAMINLMEKNHQLSIKRENFNILEFQKALANASSNEQGGLQSTTLIDRHLVTFFIPFLPLEHEHIRGCIQQQLNIILDLDEYEYVLSTDDIINGVINLIEFSSSSPQYSVSGCKKVQQKLDYIFESIRPKLKKTKKKIDDIL